MYISVTSVFTTCILTSLLIILFGFISHKSVLLSGIGVENVLFIFLALMLRMFIPLQFPYTKNIWMEDKFMGLVRALRYVVISWPIEMTVWDVIVTIWCIGVIYKLIYKICIYNKMIRYVSLLPRQKWGVVMRKCGLTSQEMTGTEDVDLVNCRELTTPYLIGLKHQYIVLPVFPYSEKQLKFILLHELMHVRNKDIILKILIDLLCTVFWWNPFFYFLKNELFQLIEMRNDIKLTEGLSEEEKRVYMECLKDTAQHLDRKDVTFGVPFGRSTFNELARRMRLITAVKKFNQWTRRAFVALAMLLLFLTSTVIFEPYSISRAEVDENAVWLTSEDMYLIENENQYDVYVFGELTMTVDREYAKYFQDVKIYKSLEEAQDD